MYLKPSSQFSGLKNKFDSICVKNFRCKSTYCNDVIPPGCIECDFVADFSQKNLLGFCALRTQKPSQKFRISGVGE